MTQPLAPLVQIVGQLLAESGDRLVFAESCTGGLVSAAMARVPGISEYLCGSAVVYRLDTKTSWLEVPAQMLREFGAVSDPVVQQMAVGVLKRTPEATLSAAITGHLGPNAPPEQDGLVYIALARRATGHDTPVVSVFERRLSADYSTTNTEGADSLREWRQWRAVEQVLSIVKHELAQGRDAL